MQRILITGGQGFVGRSIAMHIRSHEIMQACYLRSVDLKSSEDSLFDDIITDDLASSVVAERALKDIDTVIYCNVFIHAGLMGQEIERGNKLVLSNFLALCKTQSIENFIFISSSNACKVSRSSGIPETLSEKPNDSYGIVRNDMERDVVQSGIPKVSILRPHIIIGPGRSGIFESFISKLKYDKKIHIPSSFRANHQIIHITDLSKAVLKLLQGNNFGIFNSVYKPTLPLLTYAEKLKEITHSRSNLYINPLIGSGILKATSDLLNLNLFGPNRVIMNEQLLMYSDNFEELMHNEMTFDEETAWNHYFLSLI